MYFNRCEEKLYFSELQRFVWNKGKKNKGDQNESFYENVKWRHFRPSAIKDWHHPCCCHGYFFLNVVVLGACSLAVVSKLGIRRPWRVVKFFPKAKIMVYHIIKIETKIEDTVEKKNYANINSFIISLLPQAPWGDQNRITTAFKSARLI